MSDIRIVNFIDKPVNSEAIKMAEELLARLKDGSSIGIGIVDVRSDGGVATAFTSGGKYHHLNSGCATLASRVANSD